MSELPIFMHCYDASPFTQKALYLLGVKQLPWRFVETPMMPPKDDLVALTGGYRGTPVMQIGGHVYIDTQRIALELERRFPTPTLFPGGDRGFAFLAVKWADTFFRAGLAVAIETTSATWPAPFLADRKYLFPDVDFDAALRGTQAARALLRWHAHQLNRQLSDGRAFLSADAPGLTDVQVFPFVWMARAYFPDIAAQLFASLPHFHEWEKRMAAVGQGTRTPATADEAFAAARASAPQRSISIDAHDPLGLHADNEVEIAPDDTRRGSVRGKLERLTHDEIAVRRTGERSGEVLVHFPRVGYRVTPV